jgi:hypothetical protein
MKHLVLAGGGHAHVEVLRRFGNPVLRMSLGGAGFSVTCMSLKGHARRLSSRCKYLKSYSSR